MLSIFVFIPQKYSRSAADILNLASEFILLIQLNKKIRLKKEPDQVSGFLLPSRYVADLQIQEDRSQSQSAHPCAVRLQPGDDDKEGLFLLIKIYSEMFGNLI
jgi:hypothetical protein